MLDLMFIPNTEVKLYRQSGFDKFGKQTVSSTGQVYPAAIVKVSNKAIKTSKRTDASSSGGAAEEDTADIRVLLPPGSAPKREDLLEVRGQKYRVIASRDRFSVVGSRFDHVQVDAVQWLSGE